MTRIAVFCLTGILSTGLSLWAHREHHKDGHKCESSKCEHRDKRVKKITSADQAKPAPEARK